MSKIRKKETTQEVVDRPGPYEKAIRKAAKQREWQVRVLPPLITEPGSIRVMMSRGVEVVCMIDRDGIIDDRHWEDLYRVCGYFYEATTIEIEHPHES